MHRTLLILFVLILSYYEIEGKVNKLNKKANTSCPPVKCPGGKPKQCAYGYRKKDGCEICTCNDPCKPSGKTIKCGPKKRCIVDKKDDGTFIGHCADSSQKTKSKKNDKNDNKHPKGEAKAKTMSVPQLKIYRALWGAESQFSTDINRLCAEIRRLGYSGVEAALSDIHRISSKDPNAFHRALKDNQLEFIGLIQTNYPSVKNGTWQDLPIDTHVTNLEKHFEGFMPYKPVHVNIHGGQDTWSIEENEQFFEKALKVQKKYSQVTSSHETHRTRPLYNPFITAHLVKRFPTLRLTADYSHFMVVCERLLDHPTDDERFRLFASRVDHIHARVGSAEHAQVDDPLESKIETEHMQRWWEMIWDAQKNRTWITLTPEYGPVPYSMSSDIDVWDLTNREMERQKKNYEKWSKKVQ